MENYRVELYDAIVDNQAVENIDKPNMSIKERLLKKLQLRVQKVDRNFTPKEYRHKKLRMVFSVLGIVVIVSILGVALWNTYQVKQVQDLALQVDNSYTKQETGISNVRRLGNLLTIHDKQSFQWVQNNIDMSDSLRETLFPTVNGERQFTGQSISADNAPTFELVEVQYAKSDEPLSYLAVFNVMSEQGVKIYYVTCEFIGNALTAFHIC